MAQAPRRRRTSVPPRAARLAREKFFMLLAAGGGEEAPEEQVDGVARHIARREVESLKGGGLEKALDGLKVKLDGEARRQIVAHEAGDLALLDVRLAMLWCSVAALFHFLVFWFLGLNRFFWAWISCFPAVIYCASLAPTILHR